jgi:hypothetical protein
MRMADVHRSPILMKMVIDSYYNFFGNQCSPYDVEIELRKLGLNVGLIAIEWTKYPIYKKVVENNYDKVVVRKNYKRNIETTNYLVVIVCKNRHEVIAETLSYHDSVDENLCKLRESGEILSHLTNKYDEFYEAIQHGKLLMQINLCSYQNIFERVMQDNPTARIIQVKTELFVIEKDDIVISPVALQIEGNDFKYVLLGIKK